MENIQHSLDDTDQEDFPQEDFDQAIHKKRGALLARDVIFQKASAEKRSELRKRVMSANPSFQILVDLLVRLLKDRMDANLVQTCDE